MNMVAIERCSLIETAAQAGAREGGIHIFRPTAKELSGSLQNDSHDEPNLTSEHQHDTRERGEHGRQWQNGFGTEIGEKHLRHLLNFWDVPSLAM